MKAVKFLIALLKNVTTQQYFIDSREHSFGDILIMLPGQSTSSMTYSTTANRTFSNSRATPEPKLSALEKITPADRRNYCLAIVRSPASIIEEKGRAFSELQTMAPPELQSLLTTLQINEENGHGGMTSWLSYVFNGVELSRVIIAESNAAPDHHLPFTISSSTFAASRPDYAHQPGLAGNSK